MGDATSLRQVVDNLLGNVRAHTPEGTTAQVSVDGDETGAVVAVADDGPGMEPEQAAHVFERFYRSDPTRSRTHGGAGLGLSIVSAIVAAHGGTVSRPGPVGEGTTFTVHLPDGAAGSARGCLGARGRQDPPRLPDPSSPPRVPRRTVSVQAHGPTFLMDLTAGPHRAPKWT